jgi:hypothetical protein
MEEKKAWWMSKTIWANLIALVGSMVIAVGYDAGRWAEIATVALAVVNLGLRLVTKEEISLQTSE